MENTVKKIALSLALLGTAVGGVFIWNEGTRPEPLTREEQDVLHKIWNYEIEKAGGTITLEGVTEDNFVAKINERFFDLSKVETENVKLKDEEELTAKEYEDLKAGLFEKSERKSFFEKILE